MAAQPAIHAYWLRSLSRSLSGNRITVIYPRLPRPDPRSAPVGPLTGTLEDASKAILLGLVCFGLENGKSHFYGLNRIFSCRLIGFLYYRIRT
jgi:hypothetical protein